MEGGEGREKKKVGGEPGGRVATHSGPSGGSAMRRVTLFLNGSPKNGKVRGSGGGGPPAWGEGSGARNGLAGQRAEVGERGWEVGVRRGGGRPGGERRVPAASSQPAGFLAGACPSTPRPPWGPAQVSLCLSFPCPGVGPGKRRTRRARGGPLSPEHLVLMFVFPPPPRRPRCPPPLAVEGRLLPPSC